MDFNGPNERLFDHPDPDLTAILEPRAVAVRSAQEGVSGYPLPSTSLPHSSGLNLVLSSSLHTPSSKLSPPNAQGLS